MEKGNADNKSDRGRKKKYTEAFKIFLKAFIFLKNKFASLIVIKYFGRKKIKVGFTTEFYYKRVCLEINFSSVLWKRRQIANCRLYC